MDMTEKRVLQEGLDKEGGPNGRHDRKSKNNLTKRGSKCTT